MTNQIVNFIQINLHIDQVYIGIGIGAVSIFGLSKALDMVSKVPQIKLGLVTLFIGPLSWVFDRLRETKISMEISSRLEIYSKGLNIPGFRSQTVGVKVSFVEHYNNEIPEHEKIILFTDSKKGREKNLTNATILYVEKNLIPRHKQTLNGDIEQGVKIAFARKLFVDNREVAALDYLMSHMLPDEYQKNRNLERIVTELVGLDDSGVFAPVLVHQYFRLNANLLNVANVTALKSETSEFKDFLLNIVRRNRHQQVKLRFTGNFIKVLVILVGSSVNMNDLDGNKYFHAVVNDKSSDIVYLIAPALCNQTTTSDVTKTALSIVKKIADRLGKEKVCKQISDLKFWLHNGKFPIRIITMARVGGK